MLWGLGAIVLRFSCTKGHYTVYSLRWNGQHPVTELILSFNILHIYLASSLMSN